MLRGAKLVRVAEDIGGKLSFHDCTLLLTRRGRAPYLVGCVAQIVAAREASAGSGQSRAHARRSLRKTPEQGRLEFGLGLSRRFQRANDLDC